MTDGVKNLPTLVAEFNTKHDVSASDQFLVLGEETGEAQEAFLALEGKKLFKPEGSKSDVEAELAQVIYTAYSAGEAVGISPADLRARVMKEAYGNLERGDE